MDAQLLRHAVSLYSDGGGAVAPVGSLCYTGRRRLKQAGRPSTARLLGKKRDNPICPNARRYGMIQRNRHTAFRTADDTGENGNEDKSCERMVHYGTEKSGSREEGDG